MATLWPSRGDRHAEKRFIMTDPRHRLATASSSLAVETKEAKPSPPPPGAVESFLFKSFTPWACGACTEKRDFPKVD